MLYVVIPVYNAKEYLQTAVDSVLEQPSKDIKVVLVDDGSTDGSGDLCDDIAKKCQTGGGVFNPSEKCGSFGGPQCRN